MAWTPSLWLCFSASESATDEIVMTTPLDQLEQNRVGWVKAARLFSNIVSPPVIFAIVGFLVAFKAAPPPQALMWGAFYGIMVSLMPILFVLWLLHTGRVKELHMSDTRERTIPYILAVGCATTVYVVVSLFNGPELMKCLALFNIVTLAILGVVNYFWLISFHATAVSAAWLIVYLLYGPMASLLVVPFVALVAIVRLYLRRHTPAQVVAGLALGLLTVGALAQLGCFVV